MDWEKWRIQGILILFLVCFLLGFVYQLEFLSGHNLHNERAAADGSIPSDELRRLYEIEKLYLAQYHALQEAKHTENLIPPIPHTITVVESSTGLHIEQTLPNIVTAWRRAKLDWHMLLPKHNGQWERFGTPKAEGKLRLLVSKEIEVTDYLTRYHESGLSSKYGHDHGNLLPYSGCNSFFSACMIHDEASCSRDHMCSWNSLEHVCNEAVASSSSAKACSAAKTITAAGWETVRDASQCKIWVDQPAVFVTIDSESQSMFYHWWASWSTVVEHWKNVLGSDRNVHYFIQQINDPMFFQYFGLLSDKCWRRPQMQVPTGVCFCNTFMFNAHQSRVNAPASATQMLQYLQLSAVQPPPAKAKIGIISRRRKRFILNEYELVTAVQAMGHDCELLPLETMTLHEQMVALRTLDVLVGIHGSGLDNSVFLHPHSVMVQLLPYKVEHRCTFQSSAQEAQVKYMEWQLKDDKLAVFHWDLMDQANSEKLKQFTRAQLLQQGQIQADNRETLMFWINQDIIVPMDEWNKLIVRAIQQSPAIERGVRVEE